VTLPETRYARNNGLHVAYQLVDDGPVDVVLLTQWFSNVDSQWDVPPLAEFIGRLARFGRVLTFDKRGTGLSDPVPASELPSIEEWMDDLRAVLDENAIERAVLVTNLASSFMAMVFAATYPARVRALVMVNAYPRFTRADDYPWGFDSGNFDMVMERTRRTWGKGMLLRLFAPSLLADAALVELESRYERQAASPGTAMAMTRMINLIDVRSVLPTITVPTMVISRADPSAVPAGHRRYVADHIQGARYVELAGADELMWAGDQDALVGEIQEFVTGARPVAEPDRVLATILFTDIVGSTRLAAEHGDRAWRELLERHHALVRSELARFRGREVDTAGDGFLAVFDGPGRAVRCASAAVRSVQSLGIEIRAGVHTGEVEVVGDGVRGIAVHIGARVSASRAQVRSSSARRCATWSQGRVCNSKTVVPASSRVCPAHGRFSRS
jgi:pimeloyl-ACP methyl ester carboxylesterase